MTPPKTFELLWQHEIIENWLRTPGIPSEAREGLLAMQREVKEQMDKLEELRNYSC